MVFELRAVFFSSNINNSYICRKFGVIISKYFKYLKYLSIINLMKYGDCLLPVFYEWIILIKYEFINRMAFQSLAEQSVPWTFRKNGYQETMTSSSTRTILCTFSSLLPSTPCIRFVLNIKMHLSYIESIIQ